MATPNGAQGAAQATADCRRVGSNQASRLMHSNNAEGGKQKTENGQEVCR